MQVRFVFKVWGLSHGCLNTPPWVFEHTPMGIYVCVCFKAVVLSVDEEYGKDSNKPKKIRAAPREVKHKRSKNSQEDR